MDLEVRMQGVNGGDELRSYVERRIRLAFHGFRGALLWVRVHLEHQNGLKVGMDRSCRITSVTRSGMTVVVEEVDPDEQVAASRAAGRAAATLRRALDRARTAPVWNLS
jgi:Sigma 54 modulation protein / S30EA ribosomal protein